MPYRFARLAAAAFLILTTAACGSGDGPEFFWFRAVHTMPDTPTLRVSYDRYVFRRDIGFGNATDEGGESLLGGPTARLTARYLGFNGAVQDTLFSLDVPVEEGSTSTVVFAGTFDAPEAITIVSPRLKRPLAAVNFQFVHAALDAGPVDVYVTPPDTELTATAPSVTLQPRGYSDNFEVPFGTTRIRVTPAGSLDVLMDSGDLDFAEQATSTGPGSQWLFTVAPSPVAGPSPILLIGSTGRVSLRFFDADTPAAVRAVHGSPNAPPVDLVLAAEPDTVLLTGLEYTARSPVVAATPGPASLEFRVAGTAEAIATLENQTLIQGLEYSAFLVGTLEEANIALRIVPVPSAVTEARLRFANLAPDSKFFSVYLTESAEEERQPTNLFVRDLRFGAITNHLAYSPGNFFLTITERFYETSADAANAEETVVFGPTPVELLGGDVLTWAFFAPENEGEPEVLLKYDDRMP
jgi:trimeric autotransporter adhesin